MLDYLSYLVCQYFLPRGKLATRLTLTLKAHRGQTSEHARKIAGTWNSVCPRQVSNFYGLDKSTIPPVYLQLSTTHNRPS